MKDFSEYRYTVEVEYAWGWNEVQVLNFDQLDERWELIKKRWTTMRVRLLADGKVISMNYAHLVLTGPSGLDASGAPSYTGGVAVVPRWRRPSPPGRSKPARWRTNL